MSCHLQYEEYVIPGTFLAPGRRPFGWRPT